VTKAVIPMMLYTYDMEFVNKDLYKNKIANCIEVKNPPQIMVRLTKGAK
jgi:hypothetical protein